MSLYPYQSNDVKSFLITDDSIKKKNQLTTCPSENNDINILKCDQNNLSRTCPVLLCNFRKHEKENSKIYERNFSNDADRPLVSMRGGFHRCKQYIDLDSNNPDMHLNLSRKIKKNTLVKNKYIPGKGSGVEYLKNIDIDSELRNLRRYNTKCPLKKYIPDKRCSESQFSNPGLLEKPYCQNFKDYKFNDKTKSYKTKCRKDLQIVDRIIPSNEINIKSLDCNSRINFNYTNCNYQTQPVTENCPEYSSFKQCRNVTDWKTQPLLYGNNRDIPNHNNIIVGPERTNHQCENLWNNVSKRQYISEHQFNN